MVCGFFSFFLFTKTFSIYAALPVFFIQPELYHLVGIQPALSPLLRTWPRPLYTDSDFLSTNLGLISAAYQLVYSIHPALPPPLRTWPRPLDTDSDLPSTDTGLISAAYQLVYTQPCPQKRWPRSA